jgi:cell wall assembly regulator SMI1
MAHHHGFISDVTFQLARELPPDLREAYQQLRDQADRATSASSRAALTLEYDRLAARWRVWRDQPQNREAFAAGLAEALIDQDRQRAIWAEERRVEDEQRRAAEEEATRAADARVAETTAMVESDHALSGPAA